MTAIAATLASAAVLALAGMTPEAIAAATQKLTEYDFKIGIDTSGSMDDPVDSTNFSKGSRKDYMTETLQGVVNDLCKVDSDGIDLYTFGGRDVITTKGVTAQNAKTILASAWNGGSTPLHLCIERMIADASTSTKKVFCMIFTDGQPDKHDAVIKLLVDQANRQESDSQLTFQFVQVGDNAQATAFLKMLDDDLQSKYGAKNDIVDVITVDDVNQFPTATHMILHGIND
jgi:hypothetical protein